jgi:signal transduction histidine kinase
MANAITKFILFLFFLVFFIIFVVLIVKMKKLKRTNAGIMHVLEKTEKSRMDAEKLKGQFISMAAHQLKAPLSSIRLSLKMLLGQNFGKINKEQRDVLEKTCKNNEALIYLVEDLLEEAKNGDVSHFSSDSLVDLRELVVPIADFYKDEMKGKKIKFIFNQPKGSLNKKFPKVLVDKEKIKIVIQNLVDNAVKYTHDKGKIEVSIIAKKAKIEFQIKDSGIGIPNKQKGKIFERFSRADNTTGESGSGLGLFIAKDIIDKYNGKMWFESKENEGSTFSFSLPLAK